MPGYEGNRARVIVPGYEGILYLGTRVVVPG